MGSQTCHVIFTTRFMPGNNMCCPAPEIGKIAELGHHIFLHLQWFLMKLYIVSKLGKLNQVEKLILCLNEKKSEKRGINKKTKL